MVCNGNRGLFIVERQVIVCLCSQCEARAAQMGLPEMELSPTDFERHSGRSLRSRDVHAIVRNFTAYRAQFCGHSQQ